MMNLLINSAARHGKQLDGGRYMSNLSGPITDAMLRDHLAGRATYLTPVVGDDGTCRFLVFDDDHAKHLPDTKGERRRTRERALLLRRWLVSQGIPDACIMTFETGGTGTHTFVLLDRMAIDDVALVSRVLRVLAADHLGVPIKELETFPSSASNPAKGEPCRYLRLPLGLHRGTGRPSRLAVAEAGGYTWLRASEVLPSSETMMLRPLTRTEFNQILTLAQDAQDAARARTIAESRFRWSPTLPRLGHNLGPIVEYCEVFRGSFNALNSNDATSLEAIFVASIASAVEGGLERVIDDLGDEVDGYAAVLLDWAAAAQTRRPLLPFTCAGAQSAGLCPGPCAASVVGNLRHAAELSRVTDKKWFRKRVCSARVLPLNEARHQLRERMFAGAAQWMPQRRPRIRVSDKRSTMACDGAPT